MTDKFHVHKYANDALDALRRSEIIAHSAVPEINLKKAKFLILTQFNKLNIKGQKRIEALKVFNNCLYTGYLLKEQVFAFYESKCIEDAEAFLKNWASSYIASKIKPFVQLGKRLLKNAETILEYFVSRISNGFAEGINNKIKVIKRVAYGFHDFEYFRLKVLASTVFLARLP